MPLVLLAACAGLAGCASYPQDKATAIVTAPYPGKRQVDQCAPYADALFKALQANDIDAWKISYMGGEWGGTYYHALIVYRDAGALWCVDNIFPYPTKTTGTTPRQWVQERDPLLRVVLDVDFSRPAQRATAATDAAQ